MTAEEPKRVTGGAFGQFFKENRPKLQEECTGQPVTAVAKLASSKFKALGAAETKVYQDKYEKAKAQYAKDLEAFLSAGGEKKAIKRKGDKLDKDDKKKKKKMKDTNAPKKPAGGGYGCFVSKNKAAVIQECSGQPIFSAIKIVGERWKALSAAEKKPFNDEYQTKKEAYMALMKDYVSPAKEEEEEPVLSKKEEKDAAKAEKEDTKKEKNEAKEAAKQEKANAEDAKKAMKGSLFKSAAKKVIGKKAAAAEPTGVELMPNVAAEAKKAGLTEVLLKLVSRDDVKESGKTQLQMLAALESNFGHWQLAKNALLGC